MAISDDIDAILSDIATYTSAMVAIPAPDYPTALGINSAVADATQLSRDLLHMRMLVALADVQAAAAALKSETDSLKAKTDKIKATVGNIANAVKAATLILQVALAVAAL